MGHLLLFPTKTPWDNLYSAEVLDLTLQLSSSSSASFYSFPLSE